MPAVTTANLQISACSAVLDLRIADTQLTAATLVEGTLTPPTEGPRPTGTLTELPRFCRVSGMTTPAVHFEVWLPVEGWNGKYQGVGNGGMAGTISYSAMAAALKRGYATASTDTGHKAGPIPFDASWALHRPDLIEDFGHRGLHVTTVAAKQVVQSFYGEPAQYAYYLGCSKGGQQGLMEVQRYPNDFDGVVAGNPANDWTRFYAGAHLWYSLALQDDPESFIPAAKLPLLGDAVNAACDGLDGMLDGVLQDPRNCDFDVGSLQCADDASSAACLTAKQVDAVRKIWGGVENASGNVVFPGLAIAKP